MASPTSTTSSIHGFESPSTDYLRDKLSLDELLVEKASSTLVTTMRGDELIKVGVFDGDLLIVDKDLRMVNGDLILVNHNGQQKCRIIDTHRHVLISCNDLYKDEYINKCDDFTVIGVITRSVRCHRKFSAYAY